LRPSELLARLLGYSFFFGHRKRHDSFRDYGKCLSLLVHLLLCQIYRPA
jgi:hypothetical protein